MWHQLNSDWIEKQKIRKNIVEPENKKKRKRRSDSFQDAKTPAEALKMSGKLSNKMKIEAVEELFKEEYTYNPLL